MPEGNQPYTPIRLKKPLARLPYIWNEGGNTSSKHEAFSGNRKSHGERLLKELKNAEKQAEVTQFTELGDDYLAEKGFLLTFTINPNFKRQLEVLDSVTSGVELLNVKKFETANEELRSEATVFVEYGSLKYFVDKLTKYLEKEDNKPFVDPIEQIGLGSLESLWTTEKPIPDEGNPIWWEVWIRRGRSEDTRKKNVKAVKRECKKHGFKAQKLKLKLPEHTILLLKAEKAALAQSFGILNCLAEIREPVRATLTNVSTIDAPGLGLSDVAPPSPPDQDAPSVCVLDTGVNRKHPLLQPICPKKACNTWDKAWGFADDNGHGTEMCGIAAFGDLRSVQSGEPLPESTHWIESVKLLKFSHQHKPKNYGAVTQECMSLVEMKQKDRSNRVFSMAVTAEDALDFPDLAPDGLPTSWSAAIDEAIVGYLDPDQPRRIFVISGGNVFSDDLGLYPEINNKSAFEDPAHSWNAISVGAITHYGESNESCVAKIGGLSPYSRTTRSWVEHGVSDCPLKPDLVFEGGNSYVDSLKNSENLQPLSLNHKFLTKGSYLATGATSAATAAIARIAVQIHGKFPDIWPETVRALMVNSARWNPTMIEGINLKNKANVTQLVRTFGFGEPNLERAVSCNSSRATFYFEEEIQPFCKAENSSNIETNEMILFPLPIPKSVLEGLGNKRIKLYVTLSYFVEPNPGRRGLAKSKFRYANCGLRFDLKTPTESVDTLVANRSKKVHKKLEKNEKGDRGWPSKGWVIGSNNQDRGSLHHDIWEGKSVELASRDAIIVYPVNGWWKLRKQLKRWNSRQRFSLAITIETQDGEHNIYTAVEQEVKTLTVPLAVREIEASFKTQVEVTT